MHRQNSVEGGTNEMERKKRAHTHVQKAKDKLAKWDIKILIKLYIECWMEN